MTALFRREALEAKSQSALGRALLRPPVSFSVWMVVAAALAAALLAFLFLGHYTKRTRVVGITVPDAGVIQVMAPQSGVVVERRVREGQSVKAGDVLFVLSAERMTQSAGAGAVAGVQSAMQEQLRVRRSSLLAELERQAALSRQLAAALSQRLANLRSEGTQADREVATQRERFASMAAQVKRVEGLADEKFYSENAVQQKREELFEQTARRQALERTRLGIDREIAAVSAELVQSPLRAEREQADLQRAVASIEQELAGLEADRKIVITAPQDGTVTAIVVHKGQTTAAQPLLALLPASSRLEAHLFAPSRAIGFVEPGQRVRVRYAAFPYQKFGQHEGTVLAVSRSALASKDVPEMVAALTPQPAGGGEGLYRITVGLASNVVTAYGKPQQLTPGIQVEADIFQDRRRIIEWVFEPLVSLAGKL